MRAAVARGGGSRFLYEPFDAAAARIEVNERIQEERWAHLERRLAQIEVGDRPAGEADLGGGLRRRVADPRRHRLRAPARLPCPEGMDDAVSQRRVGPLETKFCGFDGELALKDGAEIAGYASLFGAADQGGDVVQKGAYGASLARLAKAGSGVKMLWQHDPTRPIGVWDEVREDGRGLYVKGRLLLEVQAAREAHVLLQARRDRRAVDRLPHAPEREGRERPAAPARDRALGGVAGHLPDAPRGAGAGRPFRRGGGSRIGPGADPGGELPRGQGDAGVSRPTCSHQGKRSMQKAESKSRAETAASGLSPQMEVKAALSGFLGEFNAFQSDIKAKLQEQETRLAMLDRKSIAMNRPPLARGRRDRDAAQEGVRRLPAVGRRRRAARPDRRGEGAVDGGGGGRRLSGRPA